MASFCTKPLSRANGSLFVEAFRLVLVTVDARDFGRHQRGAVGEVVGAVLGPGLELLLILAQLVAQRAPLVGRRQIVLRSPRQRPIEVMLGHLGKGHRRPRVALRVRRGVERGRVVLRMIACLQLADPIGVLGDREVRIALEALFEPTLVEVIVV